MTDKRKEEHFRKLASLMKQIKAVCDNYQEGSCDNIVITIDRLGDGFIYSMDNGFADYDESYDFCFFDDSDIENGKILCSGRDGCHVSIVREEDF